MKRRDQEVHYTLMLWLTAVGLLFPLTGCGNFFVKPDDSGGGGSTTTNRVYVANGATSSIAGFSIASSKLTSISGLPMTLAYVPLAVAVSRNNSFLYVAGAGAIYRYTINSDGTLTTPSTGAGVAAVTVSSMDISPDGQWLFGLDTVSTTLDEFQIDSSTGNLSVVNAIPYTPVSGTVIRRAVKVSPTANFVFAALGTAGDVVFSLNTSTGAVVNVSTLAPVSATTSDNGLAVDSAGAYLYIARSGVGTGVAVYAIASDGTISSISGSPFAAGGQPFDLAINSTTKTLYAANRTDGTISGFSIGTGSALTALSGSPYASGTSVNSLAMDSTTTYLLAGATGGTPDLSMYTFDTTTTGKLNLANSVSTDTNAAGVVGIAATH